MTAETDAGLRKRRLGKKQKAKFLASLITAENELIAKLQGSLPAVEQSGDRCDAAQQETYVYLSLSQRQEYQERLHEIKQAKKRLENNTFGVCIECEDDIPVQRLETRPFTCLCLDCKKEQEAAEERQFGRRTAYVPT